MNSKSKDRPIHEDPRLEPVSPLVRHYRNLMIEADFNDEPTYATYKGLYEHYLALEKSGMMYEPKF
jgi:hypothetical protein